MTYLLLLLPTVFILLVGLAFFVLRRRNEILYRYLTTQQEDLEEKDFFRRIPKTPSETEISASENEPSDNENSSDDVQWGTVK